MRLAEKLSGHLTRRRFAAGGLTAAILVAASLPATWGIAYGQTGPQSTQQTVPTSSSGPASLTTQAGTMTVSLPQNVLTALQNALGGNSSVSLSAGTTTSLTLSSGTSVSQGSQVGSGTVVGPIITMSLTTGGNTSLLSFNTAQATLTFPNTLFSNSLLGSLVSASGSGTTGGNLIQDILIAVFPPPPTSLRYFEQSASVAGQPASPQPIGFVRTNSTLNADGTRSVNVPVSALAGAGAVFVPVVITPSWVRNFDGNVHIFSGYDSSAVDFGRAGPAYTTFTVTGPQVLTRLPVFDSASSNYGWIDVSGVGPSGPPK